MIYLIAIFTMLPNLAWAGGKSPYHHSHRTIDVIFICADCWFGGMAYL